jgi:hypothetical protein
MFYDEIHTLFSSIQSSKNKTIHIVVATHCFKNRHLSVLVSWNHHSHLILSSGITAFLSPADGTPGQLLVRRWRSSSSESSPSSCHRRSSPAVGRARRRPEDKRQSAARSEEASWFDKTEIRAAWDILFWSSFPLGAGAELFPPAAPGYSFGAGWAGAGGRRRKRSGNRQPATGGRMWGNDLEAICYSICFPFELFPSFHILLFRSIRVRCSGFDLFF